MLIFNKQFRTEEKIISELAKKIRKSKKFIKSYKSGEAYELDTIEIEFFVVSPVEIIVFDKSGETILSMNCDRHAGDEMQDVRNRWFSELLERARIRDRKEQANKAKEIQFSDSNKARSIAEKMKKQQEEKVTMMRKALERIRSL